MSCPSAYGEPRITIELTREEARWLLNITWAQAGEPLRVIHDRIALGLARTDPSRSAIERGCCGGSCVSCPY